MKDLSGQTFGSLTAIKPVGLSKQGTVIWEFVCTCGKHTEWVGNNVVCLAKTALNPAVPSCGCIRDQRASETNTTHGYGKHPLQSTWQAMKQRCYNPKHPLYANYGAKGITVCSSWLHDAESFIHWALTNGWEKGKHLDKDSFSDSQNTLRVYSPTTCQFISPRENVSYSSRRENHKHNSRIKLTPNDICEIKQLYQSKQFNQYELAERYGVKQASIWRALHSA